MIGKWMEGLMCWRIYEWYVCLSVCVSVCLYFYIYVYACLCIHHQTPNTQHPTHVRTLPLWEPRRTCAPPPAAATRPPRACTCRTNGPVRPGSHWRCAESPTHRAEHKDEYKDTMRCERADRRDTMCSIIEYMSECIWDNTWVWMWSALVTQWLDLVIFSTHIHTHRQRHIDTENSTHMREVYALHHVLVLELVQLLAGGRAPQLGREVSCACVYVCVWMYVCVCVYIYVVVVWGGVVWGGVWCEVSRWGFANNIHIHACIQQIKPTYKPQTNQQTKQQTKQQTYEI